MRTIVVHYSCTFSRLRNYSALSADCKAMLDPSPNAFRIDNIDILQSHAQVYASDSHRNYHGTSIQCAETLPKTSVDVHNQQATDTEERVHALTPSRSPSMLMKTTKCMKMLQTAGVKHPLCVSMCNSITNEGMTSVIHSETELHSTSFLCSWWLCLSPCHIPYS